MTNLKSEKNPYQLQVKRYRNDFQTENCPYYAKRVAIGTLNTAEIYKQVVKRGGSNLSPSLMKQVTDSIFEEMACKFESGMAVNTGYFYAVQSISTLCPELAPGLYTLELLTQYQSSTKLSKNVAAVPCENVLQAE